MLSINGCKFAVRNTASLEKFDVQYIIKKLHPVKSSLNS